jgi:hypothetical protein
MSDLDKTSSQEEEEEDNDFAESDSNDSED